MTVNHLDTDEDRENRTLVHGLITRVAKARGINHKQLRADLRYAFLDPVKRRDHYSGEELEEPPEIGDVRGKPLVTLLADVERYALAYGIEKESCIT